MTTDEGKGGAIDVFAGPALAFAIDVVSAVGGWTPGDPSIEGWTIAAAYGAAALACAGAWRVAGIGAAMAAEYAGLERRGHDRRSAYLASRVFWATLALGLVGLGLNKQLDGQTWLTGVLRSVAHEQGWYEIRRQVQSVSSAATVLIALAVLAMLLRFTRTLLPRHVLAFVGAVLLGVFMVFRASSFHPVDAAFDAMVLGARVRWWLEMAGVACIVVCAMATTRWLRRRQAMTLALG